jgi:hypothetical protein
MLKELKQKREEKKQNLAEKISSRKESIKEKYVKHFPKPKLDKPTNHLIEKNQEKIIAQSTQTTRLILKFWLI